MAVANLLSGIEYYTDELRKVRKDKAKYSNEKEVFWLEERRYKAYYQQIHDYLAPKGTQQAEKEIREHIRTIITLDLEICRSKRDRCFNAIEVYEKRKDTKNQMLCFEYFQKWRDLHERYMELVAYRSLEHFALLWENNFPMTSKVFANSIDPYGDGGYTGVNKPYLHYFNRMVLVKDIKFLTKQYPTGYGKTISDAVAIAWLLGVNPDNDVLKVLGNPTLVMTTTKAIVDIMTKPFFGRVFPKFAKYFAQGENPLNMFSICRNKEGELTLADSSKPMNVKVISKDTSVDGIRVRFLFLDDICRSKDATNLKQHQIDINNYWNSWWKRNYGTDDFFVVAGGTAYSVNDILSHLISYYSKGKIIRTKQFKYAYTNEKGDCVFIKIPKIDFDFNRSTYPSKFPYEEAMRIRDRDLASFEAMEQQNPQNPETTPLAWDKLNTYEELPSGISEYAYAVLDPARTGKNYVTMGIHRVREETDKYGAKVEVHYLVDCIFQLRQMEELYGEICDKVEKHNIIKLHIENNTDTSLGFLIEKMLHERGTMFCEVSESFSTENKEEKIRELVYSSQGYFKNQMRYPCMQMYAPSSQMGKFMLYITAYDYNTKMEYDDSIDEECMYIKKFVKKVETTVKPQILWV